jgi:hypothetical protein
VVHAYILPQLQQYADQAAQDATTIPAAASGTDAAASAAADDSTSNHTAVWLSVTEAEQQHVMRLLAFPLAAGLLDVELEDSRSSSSVVQEQHQLQPHYQRQQADSPGISSGSVERRHHTTRCYQAPTRRSLFATGSTTPAACSPAAAGTPQQQHHSRQGLLAQLACSAMLVTSTGELRSALVSRAGQRGRSGGNHTLCLPKQLGNLLDLPTSFPSYSWTLVHPGYCSICPGLISAEKWAQLFRALGVQQFLPLQHVDLCLTWQQLLTDAQYRHWKLAAEQTSNDVRYVVQDWAMPELPGLLAGIQQETNAAKQRQQLRALCRVLAGMWSTAKASGWLNATYYITDTTGTAKTGAGSNSSSSSGLKGDSSSANSKAVLSAAAASWQPGSAPLPSSLLIWLKQAAWLLASDGAAHLPREMFLNLPSIHQLFQQNVLYVCEGCDLPRDMAGELGVRADTSLETILHTLRCWSQAAAAGHTEGLSVPAAVDLTVSAAVAAAAAAADASGFVTTLVDMNRIYYEVQNRVSHADIGHQKGFKALDHWNEKEQQLPQQQQIHDTGIHSSQTTISHDIAVRLSACKAFSEDNLIWLPDTAAVLAAAAKLAAQREDRADWWGEAEHGNRSGGAGQARKSQTSSAEIRRSRGRQSCNSHDPAGVADDPWCDLDVVRGLQQEPLRGKFYNPEQLRFTDDCRVLEVVHHTLMEGAQPTNAAAAAACAGSSLRVLSTYYPGLQGLFVDQLQRYKYNKWIPLVGEQCEGEKNFVCSSSMRSINICRTDPRRINQGHC